MIPFNKPYLTGKETHYIYQAVQSGKISGDGMFTKKCHAFFEARYGFTKCLLTTSCTDALEMAAILLEIEPGDEVILPSYTFVSTANAFVLRGANLIFVDSEPTNPNMDVAAIKALITPKTKAIVPVHYAGIACDMDGIMELAKEFNLFVVEDAAQAIDSYYTGKDGIPKPLGSIGHLAAFSFHETKNIMSGEGGMLVINDARFANRAEVIREKGTNRSAFFRGEIDKYGWVSDHATRGLQAAPVRYRKAAMQPRLGHRAAVRYRPDRRRAWWAGACQPDWPRAAQSLGRERYKAQCARLD